MALATYGAEIRPAVQRALGRWLEAARRHVRLTAILCVLVMSACFAAATALQMQRDYAHALSMAEAFAASESRTLAAQSAQTLDGWAAIGRAYAEAPDDATTARLVQAAGGARILNIAIADEGGRFVAAIKGRPQEARPLPPEILRGARLGPHILPYSDPAIGSSPLTLIFPAAGGGFAVMPVDPTALLPAGTLAQAALFGADGQALALDKSWQDLPDAATVKAASPMATTLHRLGRGGARRIVAFTLVPGWPLAAAASVRAAAALDTWYGSLPLYLFVILAPGIAGAALAVLLVREFERADRARSALLAVRTLSQAKARQPHIVEAELLARLAESERRANEAHRAKTEFIANMSHELRTPLNAIIGFSEIIQRGIFGPPGHEKYAEYARDIGEAGRGLHQRIGEILEFAAIEAGRLPLNLEPVDVAALARKSVEQMQGETLGRRIALDFRGASAPPAHADEAAVKRILAIVLLNAVRHAQNGGALRLEARRDGDTVVLVVRDNGIAVVDQERSPGRAPVMVGVSSTGLALGLSMAVGLARRMGGALRLHGAAGEGIWAELRLPAA